MLTTHLSTRSNDACESHTTFQTAAPEARGGKLNGRRYKPPPISLTRYWFYAALPDALASRTVAPPTLTLICVGLASAFLAKLIFSTPLSQRAFTCPGSTELGSVKERVKLPYCRSTRWKFSSFSSFSILRSPRTVRVLF